MTDRLEGIGGALKVCVASGLATNCKSIASEDINNDVVARIS